MSNYWVHRRFGRDHEKPCKRPDVLSCAMVECQMADECRWDEVKGKRISNLAVEVPKRNVLATPIHLIASILDHPSVYMGGPSRQNINKAERIWKALQAEGYVKSEE